MTKVKNFSSFISYCTINIWETEKIFVNLYS